MSSSLRRFTLACLVAGALLMQAARADEPRIDDPMRPFGRSEAAGADGSASNDVLLTAVLISPTRRVAVINGQLCREGDEVAGARVERIDARSVRLMRGGEALIVSLDTESRARPDNDGDPNQ